MPIIPRTLRRLRENDPTLIKLILNEEVESDTEVKSLVDALKNNTHLKSLTILGKNNTTGITDQGGQLLTKCTHLIYLDLSFNKNITDETASRFADHPSLKIFLANGCSVTSACHYYLFKSLTLKYLRENDPYFVSLSLSHLINSDEQVAELVHALKNNTYLKSLTIQGSLDDGGITDGGAELLASCHYLVFLDISCNRRVTDRCITKLAKHLSLETLYLRGCNVTPKGLAPFLHNNFITDLRIAISASPSEQIGESVELKLKKNANLTIEEKLQTLSAEHLSMKLCQFIHTHSSFIQKLPKPIQVMAQTIPQQWEDFVITGLTLSRHFTKLIPSAEVFVQCYGVIWEERQKFMQFQAAATQESRPKKIKRQRSESPDVPPPPSPPTYCSPSSLSQSI